MKQLILWENRDNVAEFRNESSEVDVKSVQVEANRLEIDWIDTSEAVSEQFSLSERMFRWPRHPFNTSNRVPFLEIDKFVKHDLKAHTSASRSLFFFLDKEFYSIKMPTNYPRKGVFQGVDQEDQQGKDLMQAVVARSPIYSRHVKAVQKAIGPGRDLIVLGELLAVKEPTFGNGFLVRDYRPLQNTGHYYLPAFSIDFVGQKIARYCSGNPKASQEEIDKYWLDHYGVAVGRALITLQVHYGLSNATPNAQNWLIELNGGSLCPTGRLVLRDLGDSAVLQPMAEAHASTRIGDPNLISAVSALGQTSRDFVKLFNCEPYTVWWNTKFHHSAGDFSGARRLAKNTVSKACNDRLNELFGTDYSYIQTPRAYLQNFEQAIAKIREEGHEASRKN